MAVDPGSMWEDHKPIDLMYELAHATVELELADHDATDQALWGKVRHYEDGTVCTNRFRAFLRDPRFLQLLSIQRKKVMLAHVEQISAIRTIAKQSALAAALEWQDKMIRAQADFSMEDLEKIINRSIKLFKDLEPLIPASAPEEMRTEAGAIAESYEATMKEYVERLPKSMQEKVITRWKLDNMRGMMQVESQVLKSSVDAKG